MNTWLAGSARESDDESEDQASTRLERIQGALGRFVDFETVRVVNLSPSTKRVYIAVKYEKGAAWMSFDCFKADKEWIVMRLDFQTNANLILPPNILGGQ